MSSIPSRGNHFKTLLSSSDKVRALRDFENENGFLSLFGESAEEKKKLLRNGLDPISDEAFAQTIDALESHWKKSRIFNYLDTEQQFVMFGKNGKDFFHLSELHTATGNAYRALRAASAHPEKWSEDEFNQKQEALRSCYVKEMEATPKRPGSMNEFELPDIDTAMEIITRSAEVMGLYDRAVSKINMRSLP